MFYVKFGAPQSLQNGRGFKYIKGRAASDRSVLDVVSSSSHPAFALGILERLFGQAHSRDPKSAAIMGGRGGSVKTGSLQISLGLALIFGRPGLPHIRCASSRVAGTPGKADCRCWSRTGFIHGLFYTPAFSAWCFGASHSSRGPTLKDGWLGFNLIGRDQHWSAADILADKAWRLFPLRASSRRGRRNNLAVVSGLTTSQGWLPRRATKFYSRVLRRRHHAKPSERKRVRVSKSSCCPSGCRG